MTDITTRAGKGAPLTHDEVDTNFLNLQETADLAYAASAALGGKANAAALGTDDAATDLGVFASDLITDGATAKGALQELATAIETTSGSAATKVNASAVGVAATDANMGTTPGSILSDNGTAKQWFQESESAIEARAKVTDLSSTVGTLGANLIGIRTSGTVQNVIDYLGYNSPTSYSGKWQDGSLYGDTPNNVRVFRMRDRIQVNVAAGLSTGRGLSVADKAYLTSIGWPDESYESIPHWLLKMGSATVIDSRGDMAIVGYSRTSDGVGITPGVSTAGVGGGAVIDSADGFARGAYWDLIANDLAAQGFGEEIAIKDRWTGTMPDPQPHGGNYRLMGYTINLGGDSAYGGAAKTPISAAFYAQPGSYPSANVTSLNRASNVVTAVFASNFYARVGEQITISGATDAAFNGTFTVLTASSDYRTFTWAQTAANASTTGGAGVLADLAGYKAQVGLLVHRYALYGSDGTGDSGQRAGKIVFAPAGTGYYWQNGLNAGSLGASVRSYVNTVGQDSHLVFNNGKRLNFTGSALVVGHEVNAIAWSSLNNIQAIATGNGGIALEGGTSSIVGLVFGGTGDTQARGDVRFDNSTNRLTLRAGGNGSGTSPTAGISIGASTLGFFNATPVAKPTVTGSRGGNAALASLITALANLGLITDSTTA